MSRQPLTLTAGQRRRLRRQLHQALDARVYRRTLAVLQVAQGTPVVQVARTLGVSRRAVHYWVEEYARWHDPADLFDGDRAGRPPLWTDEARSLVRELLAGSPADRGYYAVNWNVPLLQEELRHGTGHRFSDDTVRRELRRLGYVWKRPATSWTPTRTWRKKRRIRQQIRGLRPRSVVLAEDETDLLLFPPLRAGWSLRGRPAEVWLSGKNARRVVFGAMNVWTGSRLFLVRNKQRAGDFQEFLRLIHHRYRGWHVALLLDEDPSHTARGSVDLAAQFDIACLWLPKRSPKLNPMDTLWGQGKDNISANKQYATIDDQVERFIGYLSALSDTAALDTAGVHSEKFWLRKALCNYFCGPA